METSISPAAQAVLDAYGEQVGGSTAITSYERRGIASALRAVADQVVPEYDTTPWGTKIWPSEPLLSIRDRFITIAAELEGATSDPLEPNDLSHLSEEEFRSLAPQGYHGL